MLCATKQASDSRKHVHKDITEPVLYLNTNASPTYNLLALLTNPMKRYDAMTSCPTPLLANYLVISNPLIVMLLTKESESESEVNMFLG